MLFWNEVKTLWYVSYISVTQILYQQTSDLYQIPLNFWSRTACKGVTKWVLYVAEQLRVMSQCVKVSRNFVHAYSVNCCGLLCCRTLEGQQPGCTLPPPKPLHKHRYTYIYICVCVCVCVCVYIFRKGQLLCVYIYIYICRHTVTAHFSQLTNEVLTLHALNITCNGVHCGL